MIGAEGMLANDFGVAVAVGVLVEGSVLDAYSAEIVQ
jgi:hypothetical protein